MKPSSTSSPLRAESRTWIAAALLALPLLPGCVTRGTHDQVVSERDALRARNTILEVSNESLSNERVALIEEVEGLREEQAGLTRQVEALEARRVALEQDLSDREAALDEAAGAVSQLRETYDGLVQDLQDEVATGRVQIEQLSEGLSVQLAQEVLFPLGSAHLQPSGRAVLDKVAARLAELSHRVQVHGHTDDLAIHGALARIYPSNWELGGARAGAVVRLLEERGVAAERLRAISFGSTLPVASNQTEAGRARNRRIEIRLIPTGSGAVPDVAEPGPAEE